MTRLVRCDRCKTVDPDDSVRLKVGDDTVDKVDLCIDCLEDLKQWLENPEEAL